MAALRLQLDQLDLYRKGQKILSGLSLRIDAGKIWVLVGDNGAGKTTLLQALAGSCPEQLLWRGGQPDWPVAAPQLPGFRSLARQGEGRALGLSVADIMHLAAPEPQKSMMAWGLMDLAKRRVNELSAGQRQRLELARSEAQLRQPGLWLLDEPYAALDRHWQAGLTARIRAFSHLGGAVLLSMHDRELALQLGHQVLVLAEGCQRYVGDVAMLKEPALDRLLSGDAQFALQQQPFAFQSEAVSRQVAVMGNHAVARDEKRQGV